MARLMPNLIHVERPGTIEEFRRLTQEMDRSMILGGGVSLGMIPRRHVERVIYIDGLHLDSIDLNKDRLRIGAAVTLERLLESLIDMGLTEGGLLDSVLRATATTPLRNLMTVGGVIAGVGPWSDLPVALLALDAVLVVNADQEIPLARFLHTGSRELGAGDLITHIVIRRSGDGHGVFRKMGRNTTDLAMVSSAVFLKSAGETSDVAVAVGGVVSKPVRVGAVESLLRSLELQAIDASHIMDAVCDNIRPRRDPRANDQYRLHLTAQLIVDCWNDLVKELVA